MLDEIVQIGASWIPEASRDVEHQRSCRYGACEFIRVFHAFPCEDDPCYALGIRDALPEPTRLEDTSSSWASNASRAHRPEEYLHDGAEGRRGSNLEGRRRPAWEAFWGLAGAKAFRRWPCFCVDDANRTAAVAAAGIRAVSGSQDPVAANRTTDERASTR